MTFVKAVEPMASEAKPGQADSCSHHGSEGSPADVAFTAGVITVAVAFCVISVISLCHCVRHALGGGRRKAVPMDQLFCTEDEVEMAELRHFPLPHTGQVPRVRTPPSPSPSPMKFLLPPSEARLSQTRLMASRLPAADGSAQECARLTRSLPSLHTLSGGQAAHGAVEHYVEMALVSAMAASSHLELPALAPEPEPGPTEPLLSDAPPPIPPRLSAGRGRRRLQRKRYPRTPLPRGALAAAASAPPGPSHAPVESDNRSAYAPSHVTDSDDQTASRKETASTTAAPKSAGSRATTSGKVSKTARREAGWPEGSELILVSRRALERLLRRPLTAAELHTTNESGREPNRIGEPQRSRDTHPTRQQERIRDSHPTRQQRERSQDPEQDNTMHISGLQPLENTAVANEDSLPPGAETAEALADTEDNLADTEETLGETGPPGDTTGTYEQTGTLADSAETFTNTDETLTNTDKTLRDTAETSESTVVTLGGPAGAAKGQRGGWLPEPASPEWDQSADTRRRLLGTPLLAISPRSHSVV